MKPVLVSLQTSIQITLATLMLLLISPSAAIADNSIYLGVLGGERTAFASAILFDTVFTADGKSYQIGTAHLVVDDASGTNAGWRVTIGLPDGTGSPDPTGSDGIILIGLSAPDLIAGQAIDARSGPYAPGSSLPGDLRTDRTTLTAEPGFGKGAYRQLITVARPLPIDGASRTSTMTLTVTIVPAG